MSGITILNGLLSPDLTATIDPKISPAPDSGAAAIQHPILIELYRYWADLNSGLGRLPARRDISPQAIKMLLPHIAIADVLEGGVDFRFRICGTMISESAGAELTGKKWGDFPHSAKIIERSKRLITSHAPYYGTNIRAIWAPKDFQHYSVLALPLANDENRVDMILYGVVFHALDL